jgi:hypothetical protein
MTDLLKLLCPRCKKAAAKPIHPCPFESEIHDNNGPNCTCCDECANQCREDVKLHQFIGQALADRLLEAGGRFINFDWASQRSRKTPETNKDKETGQ